MYSNDYDYAIYNESLQKIYNNKIVNTSNYFFNKEKNKAISNTFINYIGYDDIGNLYILKTELLDSEMLLGEIRIECINEEGNIIGSARIPLEDFAYIPNKYVQLCSNGTIYLMVPTSKGIEIREITLGNESDSEVESLMQKALELKTNKYQEKILDSRASVPTVTRSQAVARANEIITYRWILTKKNCNVPSKVKLPDYIQVIKDSGQLENGASVSMVGIPYCWGGFDSLDTSNNTSYSNFSAAINAGYTAGNVSSESTGKVGGTTGLDCSGYVSTVYNLSSKLGTGDLSNYGTLLNSVDSLQTMDFLVRYSSSYGTNHVVLFYNWIDKSSGRFTICEANNPTDADDVTRVAAVKVEDYMNKGYKMRTPW